MSARYARGHRGTRKTVLLKDSALPERNRDRQPWPIAGPRPRMFREPRRKKRDPRDIMTAATVLLSGVAQMRARVSGWWWNRTGVHMRGRRR